MPDLKYLDSTGFRLSDDEATELCIHHLRLAAAFFMNTPHDGGAALDAEIIRQIEDRDYQVAAEPLARASRRFLRVFLEEYADRDGTQDDSPVIPIVLEDV